MGVQVSTPDFAPTRDQCRRLLAPERGQHTAAIVPVHVLVVNTQLDKRRGTCANSKAWPGHMASSLSDCSTARSPCGGAMKSRCWIGVCSAGAQPVQLRTGCMPCKGRRYWVTPGPRRSVS